MNMNTNTNTNTNACMYGDCIFLSSIRAHIVKTFIELQMLAMGAFKHVRLLANYLSHTMPGKMVSRGKKMIPFFLLCDSGVQHNNTQSRQNDKQICKRALIKLCVVKQMAKTMVKYSKIYEFAFFSEISEYRVHLRYEPKIRLPKALRKCKVFSALVASPRIYRTFCQK